MTKRVCPEPGCPILVKSGRCAEHRREKDAARGRRQARGYDAEHVRLRAAWQRRLDAGERVVCWRCEELGQPHLIDPRSWDLGHDDQDRTSYRGPECAAGNRATSARR